LEDIGLTTFVRGEIEKDKNSKFGIGDCTEDKWCTRDGRSTKMRSCSIDVVFAESLNY
jgi:hypothetical protein